MTQYVSEISVANQAVFDLNFYIQGPNGNSAQSGNYPIAQTRSIDISTVDNIQEGDQVMPHVHALLGVSHVGEAVTYASGGGTVTYTVTGTTLVFSVNLR